jgi:hypothetical protein
MNANTSMAFVERELLAIVCRVYLNAVFEIIDRSVKCSLLSLQ